MITLDGLTESSELLDLRKQPFTVGDMVIRAESVRSSGYLRLSVVTKIDNGKMYLDDSKVAIRFPGRLLIVTKLFLTE